MTHMIILYSSKDQFQFSFCFVLTHSFTFRHICRHVHIYKLIYTDNSHGISAERPCKQGHPVSTAQLEPRSWFLILLSNKKNQVSLEKWKVSEIRQGKYKYEVSLEHLVPESNHVFKD